MEVEVVVNSIKLFVVYLITVVKYSDLKYFALRKCMNEAFRNKICLRNEVTSYFISAE